MAGEGLDPVLLFRVHSRLCALPISHVRETMRPLPIQAVAEAPVYVLGVSLIRGAAIPVVDPGALIGAVESRAFGRFVTVSAGEGVVAIAVEAVLGVRGLLPSSVRRLPPLLREASGHILESLESLDAELLSVLKFARTVTDRLQRSLESTAGPA